MIQDAPQAGNLIQDHVDIQQLEFGTEDCVEHSVLGWKKHFGKSKSNSGSSLIL